MRCYKYDLHVHTSDVSSCGRISGRDQAELYRAAGYDGIVITDHLCPEYLARLGGMAWRDQIEFLFAGYRAAAERGAEIGLAVLPGLELRFQDGFEDYLVYGADLDFLRDNPELTALDLRRFRALRRSGDILVYQAHPFRPGLRAADPRLLDGIEVYNGNPRHQSRNELAFDFARRHGLRMISGSDCHQPEDVGRGGIETAERILCLEDLLAVLRGGKIKRLIGAAS